MFVIFRSAIKWVAHRDGIIAETLSVEIEFFILWLWKGEDRARNIAQLETLKLQQ